ncbi:MAG TPA: DUF192 domain-containing protein [Candidatus Angelobacter sp.]|nr:DUF192 domain-containing protein [Candidatus Angelobacter sp.]
MNQAQKSRTVRVINTTRGTLVGDRIAIADSPISRFIGLLGTSSLDPGSGLLIHPSQGIHTIGMAFAIDVIFLDRNLRVLEVRESLKPFRVTSLNWRAENVLELPVSAIQASSTRVNDQISIEVPAE